MKMNFAVGMNANERMDEIAGHARVAEESGFDFVTYVDQPYMSRDVFASMTIAALSTRRIRMGPGVVDLTTHHPLAIAGAAASVDELSGGRAIVGIGPGGAFGETMKPRSVKDVRNAVEFIRRFTGGDEVEAYGQSIRCEFRSRQLPVYMGVNGPRMLELAGEVADGVMLSSAFGVHPAMPSGGSRRSKGRTEGGPGSDEDRRMGAGHDLRGRLRGGGAPRWRYVMNSARAREKTASTQTPAVGDHRRRRARRGS